jgi:hypothetical protein
MQQRPIGQLGDPPAPVSPVDDRGSTPWYKATPKARAVRRESERAERERIPPTVERERSIQPIRLGQGMEPPM